MMKRPGQAMYILNYLILTVLVCCGLPASHAGELQSAGMDKGPSAINSDSAAEMSEAEVTRIDTAANKIGLKHGPIKNLDMPGMSMIFRVNDPAMLVKLQPGDKVKFRAEKRNGAIYVMEIQLSR